MRAYPNSSGVDGTWVKLIRAQIPFKTAGMIRHLRYDIEVTTKVRTKFQYFAISCQNNVNESTSVKYVSKECSNQAFRCNHNSTCLQFSVYSQYSVYAYEVVLEKSVL